MASNAQLTLANALPLAESLLPLLKLVSLWQETISQQSVAGMAKSPYMLILILMLSLLNMSNIFIAVIHLDYVRTSDAGVDLTLVCTDVCKQLQNLKQSYHDTGNSKNDAGVDLTLVCTDVCKQLQNLKQSYHDNSNAAG